MTQRSVTSTNPDAAFAIGRKKSRPGRILPRRQNFTHGFIFDTKKTTPQRQCQNIMVCILTNCSDHAFANVFYPLKSTVFISHQFATYPEPNNAVAVLEEGLDRK